jgi:hypothetical protein
VYRMIGYSRMAGYLLFATTVVSLTGGCTCFTANIV